MRLGPQTKNQQNVTVYFEPKDFPAPHVMAQHPLWQMTRKNIYNYLPVGYQGTSENPYLVATFVHQMIANMYAPHHLSHLPELNRGSLLNLRYRDKEQLEHFLSTSPAAGLHPLIPAPYFETEVDIRKSDASKYGWRLAAVAWRFSKKTYDLHHLTEFYISKLTKNRKTKNAYDNVDNFIYFAIGVMTCLDKQRVNEGQLRYILSIVPEEFYQQTKTVPPLKLLMRITKLAAGLEVSGVTYYGYNFMQQALSWPMLIVELLKDYSEEDLIYMLGNDVEDITHLAALRELGHTSVPEIMEQNKVIPSEWLESIAAPYAERYRSYAASSIMYHSALRW